MARPLRLEFAGALNEEGTIPFNLVIKQSIGYA